MRPPRDPWWFYAELVSVTDGDTMEFAGIDKGFFDFFGKAPDKSLAFRILPLDTWEAEKCRRAGKPVTPEEIALGLRVKAWAEALLMPTDAFGQPLPRPKIMLHTIRRGKRRKRLTDNFGRYMGQVYFQDRRGRWINYIKLVKRKGGDRNHPEVPFRFP